MEAARTRNVIDANPNANAQNVDIDSLIAQSPRERGGRPYIAGTGMTVHRVVGWYKLGLTPEEIAADYVHLTLAQVYAALAYYHANREAIEVDLDHDATEVERLERNYSQMRLTP